MIIITNEKIKVMLSWKSCGALYKIITCHRTSICP